MQKSTVSASADFIAESGKSASASRATAPHCVPKISRSAEIDLGNQAVYAGALLPTGGQNNLNLSHRITEGVACRGGGGYASVVRNVRIGHCRSLSSLLAQPPPMRTT